MPASADAALPFLHGQSCFSPLERRGHPSVESEEDEQQQSFVDPADAVTFNAASVQQHTDDPARIVVVSHSTSK